MNDDACGDLEGTCRCRLAPGHPGPWHRCGCGRWWTWTGDTPDRGAPTVDLRGRPHGDRLSPWWLLWLALVVVAALVALIGLR